MSAKRLRDAALALRMRAEMATPGPWDHGDRWHIQGATHCECSRWGELVHEGRMDINGSPMKAHVHRHPDPWPHGIYGQPSKATGWHPPNVVNDTDEYGYMDDDDARFIATMHPGVALALADWLDAEALVCSEPIDRTRAAALHAADLILGDQP